VNIDVYRSCTWREKRDVLNVFWRTNVDATSRIVVAAAQYGYYAVISLVVVMAEVALILWVGLEHNALVAGLAAALELFMIWSTWWAIKALQVLEVPPCYLTRSRFRFVSCRSKWLWLESMTPWPGLATTRRKFRCRRWPPRSNHR